MYRNNEAAIRTSKGIERLEQVVDRELIENIVKLKENEQNKAQK